MPWLMYNMTYIGLYWFICMLVAVFFFFFIPKLFLKYIFLKMVKKNASKWTNLIKYFSFYFWEKCKRRWYLCILCVWCFYFFGSFLFPFLCISYALYSFIFYFWINFCCWISHFCTELFAWKCYFVYIDTPK